MCPYRTSTAPSCWSLQCIVRRETLGLSGTVLVRRGCLDVLGFTPRVVLGKQMPRFRTGTGHLHYGVPLSVSFGRVFILSLHPRAPLLGADVCPWSFRNLGRPVPPDCTRVVTCAAPVSRDGSSRVGTGSSVTGRRRLGHEFESRTRGGAGYVYLWWGVPEAPRSFGIGTLSVSRKAGPCSLLVPGLGSTQGPSVRHPGVRVDRPSGVMG